MKYLENIVFFYGFDSENIECCYGFTPLKSSAHFSEDADYYFSYNDETFIQKFFDVIERIYPKYPVDDVKIYISDNGFVNIQLIKNNFNLNTDIFDYEKAYTEFNDFLSYLLFEKYKKYFKKNEYILEVDFEYRYLFHQHEIIDKTEKKENEKIKWSYYKYNEKKEERPLDIPYIDTYIIETNLLYMVFTQMFLHYMDDKNITLEKAREMLTVSRKKIAKHTFLFREFATASVEFIQENKLFEKHNTPYMQNLYEKLDKDFETLAQNMESNRQEKFSIKLNKTILILTTLNVLSVVLAYISVIFSKKEAPFKMYDLSSFIVSYFEVFLYCIGIVFMLVVTSAIFLVSMEKLKKFFILFLEEKKC